MRNPLQHTYKRLEAPLESFCMSVVAFYVVWALSRHNFDFTQAACAGFADAMLALFSLVAEGCVSKQAGCHFSKREENCFCVPLRREFAACKAACICSLRVNSQQNRRC